MPKLFRIGQQSELFVELFLPRVITALVLKSNVIVPSNAIVSIQC